MSDKSAFCPGCRKPWAWHKIGVDNQTTSWGKDTPQKTVSSYVLMSKLDDGKLIICKVGFFDGQ